MVQNSNSDFMESNWNFVSIFTENLGQRELPIRFHINSIYFAISGATGAVYLMNIYTAYLPNIAWYLLTLKVTCFFFFLKIEFT